MADGLVWCRGGAWPDLSSFTFGKRAGGGGAGALIATWGDSPDLKEVGRC